MSEHPLTPVREPDEFGFVPVWCDECGRSYTNAEEHDCEVGDV
jgi:hypothetical protein